jgi:hypothetical protein
VLKAFPLQDVDYAKAFRDELFKVFGEEHKDAAQFRLNIINNARKVAHGGEKDGKKIKGRGTAYMLEVLERVRQPA